MEFILKLVLFVDIVVACKVIGSMVRAKFNKDVYINQTFYARMGALILFHLIMVVVSGFVLYIGAIVDATL